MRIMRREYGNDDRRKHQGFLGLGELQSVSKVVLWKCRRMRHSPPGLHPHGSRDWKSIAPMEIGSMRVLAGSWTVDRTTTAAPGADDFVELHDTPQGGG